MPDLFPNPPVKTVSASPFITADIHNISAFGPFQYSSARWGIGFIQSGGPYYLLTSVIKSTDGGATWTVMDQANTPATISWTNGEPSYIFDATNGLIHILGRRTGNTANNLSYATFNMATGLYGATIDGAIRASNFKIAVRADATPIALYVPLTGAGNGTTINQPINYSLITGAAFQTPVQLAAAVATVFHTTLGTILDTDGALHLLYQTSGTPQTVHEVALSSSAVASTPTLTYTNPGPSVWSTPWTTGIGAAWTNLSGGSKHLLWAVNDTNSDSVLMFDGTPWASPTWTTRTVATTTTHQASFQAHVVVSANEPNIFWYFGNDIGANRLIEYSIWDGSSFTARATAWNVTTNGASGDPGENIDAFNVVSVSTHFEMLADEFIDGSFNQTLVFLSSPSVSVAGTPPDGAVGFLYDATFTASGGTAPYTYGATGLPDGLTMDATTGVVSGLPTTAGASSVTITATDSLSASGSETVTITIDSGGGCNPSWLDGEGWSSCSTNCARTGTFGATHIADGTAATGTADDVSAQIITVEADQRYYLSFWFKTSGGADGTIGFGLSFYTAGNVFIESDFITSSAHPTDWTRVQGTIVVPANATQAVPTLRVTDHLVNLSVYCIDDLLMFLTGGNWLLSSIKHYADQYVAWR